MFLHFVLGTQSFAVYERMMHSWRGWHRCDLSVQSSTSVLLVTSVLVSLAAGNYRSTQCQVLSEAL